MLRLLIGLALMPSSALVLAAALRALVMLSPSLSTLPFFVGFVLSLLFWLWGRHGAGDSWAWSRLGSAARRAYVFGHELTHALAAWSVGAKVLGFKAGDSGGHVDLSRSNAFIALAPYCAPIYAVPVVLGYRLWLAARPAGGGEGIFLGLMGLVLAFHMTQTFDCLWDNRQPDLSAAGGAVFSLSAIAFANGLVVLGLLKALFPGAVAFSASLRWAARWSWDFWAWTYRFVLPLKTSLVAQLKR